MTGICRKEWNAFVTESFLLTTALLNKISYTQSLPEVYLLFLARALDPSTPTLKKKKQEHMWISGNHGPHPKHTGPVSGNLFGIFQLCFSHGIRNPLGQGNMPTHSYLWPPCRSQCTLLGFWNPVQMPRVHLYDIY